MTIKVQVSANFAAPFVSGSSTITIPTTAASITPTARIVYFNSPTPITRSLPDAASWALINQNASLLLKDISGAAETNNITINRDGSNTIDGLTSFVISANYGFFELRVTPSGNWTFVG